MNLIKELGKKIKRKLFESKVPQISGYPFASKQGFVVTHISAFTHANTGDLFLPVVLRNLFNSYIPIRKWINRHVFKIVTAKDVSSFNKSDFMVIGGGGLLLTDTNPNNLSGWQWSCSIENLKKIKVPIIAFAIGYNRFRNQEDFKPIFTEHLNCFVEKSVFIGIRNHGSIQKLKNYLRTEDLRNKLRYQPCMTTLTSLIYNGLYKFEAKENFIAFNCAFDRQNLRNSNDIILQQIANVALQLSKISKIKYYSHVSNDEQILPYFDRIGVPYQLVRLKKVKQTILEYSKPRLVIGMRGHAQMIPFGCNTPILSIISHDKMQWFLDDIHHPEWGVDVLNPSFETELLEKAKELYNSTDALIPILKEEQQILWNITQQNMNFIKSIIKNK